MNNPFFNRGPIREPRFYFPRPRETREILRLLAGSQNCSVVGPIKSGKTSLLLHLARPGTLAGHGLSPSQHRAVYLSFEGLGALSPEQFFHLMVGEMARQAFGKAALLWPRFEARDALSFLDLEELLDQVEVAGERLIFLLDEVDLAAENPAFDLNFFSALRHIASRPGVCFVTASERRLHEIKIAGRDVGSPFADLFSVVRLHHLDPDLAWRQVAALAAEAGADLSAERDFILELAGCWPYYLQVVAFEAFDGVRAGTDTDGPLAGPVLGVQPLTEDQRWYVQSRAREQLEPVLAMLWDRLGEGVQEAAVAALGEGSGAPEVEGLTVAAPGGAQPAGAIVAHFLDQRRRDRDTGPEDYAYIAGAAEGPRGLGEEPAPLAAAPPLDRQAMYGVVRALMRAVEARDRYARRHAERVARLASAIAREMGCSGEAVEGIRVAARLHDIGRVSISDMILLKPGPLTELELEIIRTHTLVGAQILDVLEFPWSVKPAVRYHHERLDGSGYPEGLMGEEIPLAARVLAAADVASAMTEERPYRRAASEADAWAELTAHAGTKYDPEVVKALGRVMQAGAGLTAPPVA
jgi:putative nucleotidyltransferase with HDIG domain